MKERNRLMMKALTELSLVDNPANQHSHVAIFKRATTVQAKARVGFRKVFTQFLAAVTPHVTKEAQSYAATRAVDQLWSKTNDLSSSIASILSDDLTAEKKQELLDVTLSQFRDDIQALNVDDAAFDASEDEGEDVNKGTGATPPAPEPTRVPAPAAAPPSAGETGDSHTEGMTMKRIAKSFTDLAAANAHIATLTGELETADESISKLEATADPIAAITKGMPEPAAKAYREQAERVAKLEADARNATTVSKALVIIGKTGDATDADKLANVLKKLGDDAAGVEFLTEVFKNYGALLGEVEGLEIGHTAGGEASGADDAMAQINKFADELQTANPTMSRVVAVNKAMDLHPELYNESELSVPVAG